MVYAMSVLIMSRRKRSDDVGEVIEKEKREVKEREGFTHA